MTGAPGRRGTANAVDIVVNLFTPREVREGRLGIDPSFMAQLRMAPKTRTGVRIPSYLKQMDRADIAASLLVAARAGVARERDSAEIPYRTRPKPRMPRTRKVSIL